MWLFLGGGFLKEEVAERIKLMMGQYSANVCGIHMIFDMEYIYTYTRYTLLYGIHTIFYPYPYDVLHHKFVWLYFKYMFLKYFHFHILHSRFF